MFSILGPRAAQRCVRVKCPGAAVARGGANGASAGTHLAEVRGSPVRPPAPSTPLYLHTIYTLSTISTISTVDTLHSTRQTNREKVDIWLREDLLICSASSTRVSWIFPIRYNWFVTRRRCRCDVQICRHSVSRWRCFLVVLKRFFLPLTFRIW